MKSNVAADSDLHTEIILLILSISSYFMNYDNEEICQICIIIIACMVKIYSLQKRKL